MSIMAWGSSSGAPERIRALGGTREATVPSVARMRELEPEEGSYCSRSSAATSPGRTPAGVVRSTSTKPSTASVSTPRSR